MTNRPDISLWVDPMDPWGWVVARWLKQADQFRDTPFAVRVLSVALLNEAREVPPQYEHEAAAFAERMRQSLGPVRVLTAVEQEFGSGALKDLYFALGHQIHVLGSDGFEKAIEPALADAGLPMRLAAAAASDAFDEQLRRSHEEGMKAVQIEAGSPILQVGSQTFFGPVMSRAPEGSQAAELLEAFERLAQHGAVYELKSARLEEPVPA